MADVNEIIPPVPEPPEDEPGAAGDRKKMTAAAAATPADRDLPAADEPAVLQDADDKPEGEPRSYAEAKSRLDDIVKQVRAKDVSLERSLDLLEEGVKLANQCTELIDQTRWESDEAPEESSEEGSADNAATTTAADSAPDNTKEDEAAKQ